MRLHDVSVDVTIDIYVDVVNDVHGPSSARDRLSGTDRQAEASMCPTFVKLSRDEVEVIADGPVLASIAAWQ